MLPEIKQLPDSLSNMIAAGEVIERPASVVKELIENSIDAGAKYIKIDLINSGLKKITVLDDGCGMKKEQVPIALLRHATSKIKSAEDLFNISTLGFRGEALPSIASVSYLTITSSTNSMDGYMYQYKAGQLMKSSPASMPKGTKIEVENLFFNTPARFKHLGNEYLELSHITMLINRFAISNPYLKFTLNNNNKLILKTDGSGDISSLIATIYGSECAKESIAFSAQNNLYEIKGYTSKNKVYRSNKNAINIIVNNRIIRNLNILFAVTDAYKTILPIGKYPITILEIICDPALIDVNVHPSKLEIRFTDEMSLRGMITKTINDSLYQENLTYNVLNEDIPASNNTIDKNKENLNKDENPLKNNSSNLSIDDWDAFSIDTKAGQGPFLEDEIKKTDDLLSDTLWDDNNDTIVNKTQPKEVEQEKLIENNDRFLFSSLNYIGQFNKTYLLLEDDKNLYLIDQHAAMERIMYEKIKKAFSSQTSECYDLLIPLKFDYPQGEKSLILSKEEEFKKIGITIENFGGTTILIRSIPLWIPEGYERDYLADIIDRIINQKEVNKLIMNDSFAKMLACKKSIKANMNILVEEVKTLLHNLDLCEMPYTCPHGRPTLIKFSVYEIEKLFHRVM